MLVVGPGNYALGHVTLDLATGAGEITFAGGAGEFTTVPCESGRLAVGWSQRGLGREVPFRLAALSRGLLPTRGGSPVRRAAPSRRVHAIAEVEC